MLELVASPAFTTLPQGRGLAVSAVDGLGIAMVQALAGPPTDLSARIAAITGLALPDGPRASFAPRHTALGIGPGRWLVLAEGEPNVLVPRLAAAIGPAGVVNDQSDGYAILRLVGPNCLPVLARGVNIDLAPVAFPPGAVAATSIAHLGVIVWRLPDMEGAPVFMLAVFRSLAGSLLHWLETAIAGAGLASA
jgi:methylglutamate dehydrogenase subunit D